MSEQYPHLIFEGFSSQLGSRVRDVLKYLFPVPKEDSKRVMTFSNDDDFISFRYAPATMASGTTNTVADITSSSRSHQNKSNLQRLVHGSR